MNADIRTPTLARAAAGFSLSLSLALPAVAHAQAGMPWIAGTDPLRTHPPELDDRLRLPLPPDLPAAAQAADGSPAATLAADCATRTGSLRADSAQWALQTLSDSQPPGPPTGLPTLSLSVAIQLAACHNPQLRASWSQIAQQAAQAGQARSAYWPQWSASMARQRSRISYADGGIPASTNQVSTQNTTLSWRLWDFGARSARVDAAQAQVQAALGQQSALLHKTVADVLHSYAEVQSGQARLAAQHALLPLAQRNLLSAERRLAGGVGSLNDRLQAAAARSRIALEQSRAEGELRKALAQLVFLLGLPPGTALQASPLLPDATREVTGSLEPDAEGQDPPAPLLLPATRQLLDRALDDWLDHARAHHPAIEAARAQLQAAEASFRATRADGLPTVDLNLSHYRNGRPNVALSATRSRDSVAGISLTIPLFDGFAGTYRQSAAQALVEQRQVELQAAEQQTLHDVVQLHAQAHAGLNNLQAAASLYRAAKAAAHSAQRQYDRGALDVLQLNQALIAWQQAQQELAQAQLEWSRARWKLWLVGAAGNPSPAASP